MVSVPEIRETDPTLPYVEKNRESSVSFSALTSFNSLVSCTVKNSTAVHRSVLHSAAL